MKTDINVWAVLIILTFHFIADFIFQDEEWATGKSKSVKPLIKHTATYTWILFLSFALFCSYNNHFTQITASDYGLDWKIFLFFPITFICHTITDFFTSKVTSRLFAEKKYGSSIPNLGAFTMIGFDQLLHFFQLMITYQYLTL